ncbi:MAG: LacI family DNA-binding transcriptional regulator [Clostridia bacterium]|nr:LacI family DNA-binding transcriptional regulator [Clostridia bacterium]
MVTLKDISARCGCSVATVSKALNGMPDISQETARHIRAVAAEMGYMPNAAARTLKTHRSRTIGLIMFLKNENVWTHDFFSQIAAGIQSITEEKGYDITPINAQKLGETDRLLNYCIHRGYDGLIVMSAGFGESDVQGLLSSRIPLVSIDHTFPGRSAVLSDNLQGTRELVRYAYSMGHRRIAFIHGEDTPVTQGRLKSFCAACEELSLDIPPEYLKPAIYHNMESAAQATRELLRLENRPTCILYQDDYCCIGTRNILEREGSPIPPEISVAGYDGTRLADMFLPRLTTFRQNSEMIGQEAAQMLLNAIENPQETHFRHITVPGSLIIGESIRRID